MIDDIRVGFFLAVRYLRYASKWTTGLVIFIMMVTFMNLVFTTGILVGLIEGAIQSFKNQYAGDVIVSVHPDKSYIEKSSEIVATIDSIPEVDHFVRRYVTFGELEANFLRNTGSRNYVPDVVGSEVVGIDPREENELTGLQSRLLEGEFLDYGDEEFVVLGAYLIDRFIPGSVGLQTVSDVYVGDKIRLSVNGIEKEYRVKGIIKSKADQVDRRIFMIDRELRKLIGRTDYNLNEIAIRVTPGIDPDVVKTKLIQSGVEQYAQVRRAEEALGTFLEDIRNTFSMLGNVIGSISLVVTSITIFIVIYITAVTRRKFIGILKGIGVSSIAIECSYILLSVFYALIGIFIGIVVLYGFLVPYFDRNPINFPFSDGILAVTTAGTALRAGLILLTTIIAGYIPARIIVQKNTLDAILGR